MKPITQVNEQSFQINYFLDHLKVLSYLNVHLHWVTLPILLSKQTFLSKYEESNITKIFQRSKIMDISSAYPICVEEKHQTWLFYNVVMPIVFLFDFFMRKLFHFLFLLLLEIPTEGYILMKASVIGWCVQEQHRFNGHFMSRAKSEGLCWISISSSLSTRNLQHKILQAILATFDYSQYQTTSTVL